jgi:hypothetical protein
LIANRERREKIFSIGPPRKLLRCADLTTVLFTDQVRAVQRKKGRGPNWRLSPKVGWSSNQPITGNTRR